MIEDPVDDASPRITSEEDGHAALLRDVLAELDKDAEELEPDEPVGADELAAADILEEIFAEEERRDRLQEELDAAGVDAEVTEVDLEEVLAAIDLQERSHQGEEEDLPEPTAPAPPAAAEPVAPVPAPARPAAAAPRQAGLLRAPRQAELIFDLRPHGLAGELRFNQKGFTVCALTMLVGSHAVGRGSALLAGRDPEPAAPSGHLSAGCASLRNTQASLSMWRLALEATQSV